MSEATTAIIVVSISSLITIIITIISNLYQRTRHYSNIIAQYRMEWINSLYRDGAQFIALLSTKKPESYTESEKENYEFLKTSIILRLKPTENAYKEEKRLMLLLQSSNNQIYDNAFEIRSLIQVICNKQWDKVKAEAGRRRLFNKTK